MKNSSRSTVIILLLVAVLLFIVGLRLGGKIERIDTAAKINALKTASRRPTSEPFAVKKFLSTPCGIQFLYPSIFQQAEESTDEAKLTYQDQIITFHCNRSKIIGFNDRKPKVKLEDKRTVVKDNELRLTRKAEQGFTNLLVVPHLPIGEEDNGYYSFAYRIKQLILSHHKRGLIFGTRTSRGEVDRNTVLKVSQNQPLYIWENFIDDLTTTNLIYHPRSFDKKHHGGETKPQFMRRLQNTPFPGYEVLLTEPYAFLPYQRQGQTKGGRKQLENKQTPNDYLNTLKTPPYDDEIGYTIETFLTEWAVGLASVHQVRYDYHDDNVLFLIGHTSFDRVPFGYWRRDCDQLRVVGDYPDSYSEAWGCRSAVRVGGVKL